MRLLFKVIILFFSSVAPAITDTFDFSFKSIDGGSFSNFTGGATGHGLITYRISGGGTAWDHVNFMVYDTPNTTSSIIYKLYLRSNDNNQNVRIGENGAEEFMSAMEIRQ